MASGRPNGTSLQAPHMGQCIKPAALSSRIAFPDCLVGAPGGFHVSHVAKVLHQLSGIPEGRGTPSFKFVAHQFALGNRRKSWSHHLAVSPMPFSIVATSAAN